MSARSSGCLDEQVQVVSVDHGSHPLATTGQVDRVMPDAGGVNNVSQLGLSFADGDLIHSRTVRIAAPLYNSAK